MLICVFEIFCAHYRIFAENKSSGPDQLHLEFADTHIICSDFLDHGSVCTI